MSGRKKKQAIRKQEENRIKKITKCKQLLYSNFQYFNIHIIGVPEGEEKEQEIGNLLEKIMKVNFSNLVKEIDMQVQEAQRAPNKMDAKRPTPSCIIIKMLKFKYKERISQAARENQLPTGKFLQTIS